ncbi:integrator complex subunit 11 [Capsaspora owczarzaki ATCC 30864]|uniref:Integrator complex subunit 11 n=1 Tax=Capsaspora owczarzaki (strain ATCC 30864) TaxID=595528 RepID=A0A0D2UH27_CAPO3|nr:integrator complex subunit 11 [Capsaspora owczarzaki ATCC 30864]KJE94421.1 integrator complex subunit 11 [Capsaspora owczarzaki ATCC 30864]|eukprot:XP_004346749.1 integrator complex subunit 11 [Capsaspora owczarzaki ATCC 30864]
MVIRVRPLGAGQDVGRSCLLVSIGGKNIMFDCGMHMGYNDARRFPDFASIKRTGPYTDVIDCVIVSHFHLDHCGAIVHFSEVCGYDGPIYMTHPTKAICPILLEDYRKLTVERKGETNFFTSANIKACMKKVIAVNLHESVRVDDEIEIKAYYAGHVLGAAMFHVRVGSESVVYTGDFNMTPDRHLGAAWIDRCRPDLLITESTYATTIRDSKRNREGEFLRKIHECVEQGGKVLIPVFALGRAQELCILVETYWERLGLTVPVYFSAGLTAKANNYYKLFITWTNQKIKRTFVERNMFEFKHIKPFDRAFLDNPGPMVLFATPGMLHAGMSLDAFRKWAPNDKNMVILPGYCVAGTVGNKVLAGHKQIEMPDRARTVIDVRLSVQNLSFSAHADAKGIVQLIRHAEPRNVMLVHGEKAKMAFLKAKIISEIGIPCFDPANGATVTIETAHPISVSVPPNYVLDSVLDATRQRRNAAEMGLPDEAASASLTPQQALRRDAERDASELLEELYRSKRVRSVPGLPIQSTTVRGVLVMKENEPLRLVHASDVTSHDNTATSDEVEFHHSIALLFVSQMPFAAIVESLRGSLQALDSAILETSPANDTEKLSWLVSNAIRVSLNEHDVEVSWTAKHHTLGERVAHILADALDEMAVECAQMSSS